MGRVGSNPSVKKSANCPMTGLHYVGGRHVGGQGILLRIQPNANRALAYVVIVLLVGEEKRFNAKFLSQQKKFVDWAH
jgi:hypothetical protein